MRTERSTAGDETKGARDEDFRTKRCDWRREARRWWEKAEAYDPERWKAMAAVWASMWHDGTGETHAEQGTAVATKTCPYCAEEIKQAAIKCKHCGTWLAYPPEPITDHDVPTPGFFDVASGHEWFPSRKLTRSTGDVKAFGVLGGLGHFLGVDPTLLRIAYALGTLFTAVIPGIAVYGIMAAIIPSDVPVKGPRLE